ncbi:hypothetical protein ACVWWW_000189 [Lysobacter sp. HA18]
MRLGGWTRIWIVLSALFAICAGVIAYGTMPSRQSVLSDWYSDATEAISARIPGPDGQPISSYEVHDSFFSGTEKENLEFLRVLAEGRTDNIKLSALKSAPSTPNTSGTRPSAPQPGRPLGVSIWLVGRDCRGDISGGLDSAVDLPWVPCEYGLTIRPSRRRFAARLNSGVRPRTKRQGRLMRRLAIAAPLLRNRQRCICAVPCGFVCRVGGSDRPPRRHREPRNRPHLQESAARGLCISRYRRLRGRERRCLCLGERAARRSDHWLGFVVPLHCLDPAVKGRHCPRS